jgi:excisionase family DNA binding protein
MMVMLMQEMTIFTPEDVARRLRVSEETVRREIRGNHLNAQRIGKQYRISAGDLKAYLGDARFTEWFLQANDLRDAIGSGGLPEAEAIALADKAVRQVREERPAPAAGQKAPTKAEIQAHLKTVRQAREKRD